MHHSNDNSNKNSWRKIHESKYQKLNDSIETSDLVRKVIWLSLFKKKEENFNANDQWY